ncbi:MAG: hypothetical protein RBS19_06215 [Bacteroidales bacterium]|nr:hypothetical protein [Bacteroidales bacterium]
MKKKLLILILLIIAAKIGWTQNTNLDYKSALKIYNLTSFDEQTISRRLTASSPLYQYTYTTLQILHPTIAFQWRSKKNNFHEIELTSFMLGKIGKTTDTITTNSAQTISGGDLTITAISLRYEYILNFNKSKDCKLVTSIGFGINPYYRQNTNSPKISSSFHTSDFNIGMRAFITPRISYFLTSKLFLDLNIPLCIFDSFYYTGKDDNPALSLLERTTNTYKFSLFSKVFSGRIGIGIKL